MRRTRRAAAYRDRARHARATRCASNARDGELVGEAVAVTDDGALVVRDDAGTEHPVIAGDVDPPPLRPD